MITLENYIYLLQQLVKENPSAKKLQVIYSSDDEWNSFHNVWSAPTIWYFEDTEFMDSDFTTANAVCIN